jgi:peroxiredoxin
MNMEKTSALNLDRWVDEHLGMLSLPEDWCPNVNHGLAVLRQFKSARNRVARGSIWIGVAAATVCVFLAVLPQPSVLAHRCIDCSVALWQDLATVTSPLDANLTPTASRKPAPEFTLNDSAGNSVNLSSLRGKVVLLNFWATWCGGCQIEISWFMEFQARYKNDGLAVIGISTDDDGWKSVSPYMKEKKLNYTIMVDDAKVGKLYGLDSMPMTILIDRDGKIAAKHVGLVSKSEYKAEIETVLRK